MQVPKNNLDDVLRRKASSSISEPSTSVASVAPKTLKFKPAALKHIPSIGGSARKPTSTALPSFSTPGFVKSRPHPAQPSASQHIREAISISSDSSPSSPPRSIKRASSDTSVAFDPPPQSSKRPRKDLLAEKENISRSSSKSTIKGKSKALFHVPKPKELGNDDNEPWKKMELETERNPWARLDRDYPAYSTPVAALKAPDIPEQDQDLLSKDKETLKSLLLEDHELSRIITERELAYHCSTSTSMDIVILQRVRETLTGRIDSIKKVLSFREKQFQDPPNPRALGNRSLVPVSPLPGSSEECISFSSNKISVPEPSTAGRNDHEAFAKSRTVHDEAKHAGPSFYVPSCDEESFNDEQVMPPSEADYWAGMDDVPMDDVYAEAGSHMRTKGFPTLVATPNSHLASGPYYSEIMKQLRRVFGLENFRHNQLEAITEALTGRDVFVLMPTGGGKSLCYQLPAVCKVGKTIGVTVVVSPLLALMKDQVHALKEKNVDVFLWNSEASWDEAKLRMRTGPKPNLMYITPEKLKESNVAQSILAELYRNRELARFVVDEAHCISTWGQDFREAYRDLGSLRVQYPDVPIMALTATARRLTVADIEKRLGLRDCAFFTQSFNRPNLRYIIQPKPKKWLEEIMNFISSKHPRESGVIYCLGRDKCEEVAKKLQEQGFSAKHFHARMEQADKDRTLDEWRNGSVHIIVATIAFGMGIDKADVRFVIHQSMPKSLDGYYQETGRAGRDGKPADCILYYLYQDFIAVCKMIKRPDKDNIAPTPESIQRQTEAARAVVDYCLNISECRRVQLLHYFDEKFNKKDCVRGCDNCSHSAPLITRTVTKEATAAVELVQMFQKKREAITLAQCRDILRGANTVVIRARQYGKLPLHGAARELPSELLEQMLRRLCLMDVLMENSVMQSSGWHIEYVVVGPAYESFLSSNRDMEIHWRPKSGKPTKQLPEKRPLRIKQRLLPGLEEPIELYEDDAPLETSVRDDIMEGEGDEQNDSATPVSHTPDSSTVGLSTTQGRLPSVGGDPASDLYGRMCILREKIMKRDGISNLNQVLDDTTLEFLSATCPQDYVAFKQNMKDIVDDVMDQDESIDYVNDKCERYGRDFLHLCIEHKIGAKPSFDVVKLRSRFGYQDPTVKGVRISSFKLQQGS